MKRIKTVYNLLSNIIEVYLPSITFVALFVSYIIMILYRYFFNAGVNKIYELSMIFFVWTVIFSASYCSRTDNHIMFTMLYDRLSPRNQFICHFFGDVAIVVVMAMLLPYTIDSVSFLKIKKTSMLKIPFNIVYAPIIFYNVLTIIHHFINAIKNIYSFVTYGKEKNNE